jgi:hypothetical protein
MGDDSRMGLEWWNGENVDDRSRTYLIHCVMKIMDLLVSYNWMSDISTQLLLEQHTNEQPLEILPK